MLKAIIFDCDGVLLDESYKPLIQELRRHSKVSPGKIERDIVNLEQRFYGAKSSTAFWSDLRQKYDTRLPRQNLIALYNKDRLLPPYFLTKKLAKGFILVLLSNQIEDRADYLKRKNRFGHFHHVFFSNEIRLAKPYARTFRFVLERVGAKASECLFIDDDGKNVQVARRLGLLAIEYKRYEQLKRRLKALNIL